MKKYIICILCLLLQGCIVESTKGKLSGGDNLFGMMDKIQTTGRNPTVRQQYVPTNKELQYINNNKIIKRLEKNYFLILTSFAYENIVIQKTNSDCWAACTIMLLKHEKVLFPSSDVKKLRSELLNAKEAKNEVSVYVKLMNSYKKVSYTKPVTSSMLLDSLANDHPILVGFQYPGQAEGHIQLVVGCYYSYMKPTFADDLIERKVEMAVDKVILIDPADGGIKEISADAFVQTASFAISFIPKLQETSFIGF